MRSVLQKESRLLFLASRAIKLEIHSPTVLESLVLLMKSSENSIIREKATKLFLEVKKSYE